MKDEAFLESFSRHLASILPTMGTKEFTPKLAAMFKALVPTNNVMVILYIPKQLPIIAYNDLPPDDRTSTVDLYVKGAFLLDPFYLAVRKHNLRGFYHLCDVTSEGFEHSEYTSSYFKHSGLADECSYLIQLGDDDDEFVIVSLGQINVGHEFSQAHLDNLTAIAPLIDSLINQHWASFEGDNNMQQDMRIQLETALEAFGTSVLTERENQTIQMILHGYSNRGIAERLEISIETVKLHRKNAYAKLDLGSQGELFNLFISSLLNIENYTGGDPLIPYLERTKPVSQ